MTFLSLYKQILVFCFKNQPLLFQLTLNQVITYIDRSKERACVYHAVHFAFLHEMWQVAWDETVHLQSSSGLMNTAALVAGKGEIFWTIQSTPFFFTSFLGPHQPAPYYVRNVPSLFKHCGCKTLQGHDTRVLQFITSPERSGTVSPENVYLRVPTETNTSLFYEVSGFQVAS
jgi:hypothetical protein